MTHSPLPLIIEDVSRFATSLRASWPQDAPGQAQMLGLIARAAGYRNHQHLRAAQPEEVALDKHAELRIRDALRCFDPQAQMTRWPQKTSVQRLCLTWFWSRLPARIDLTEPQVNEILRAGEQFGDHVLLRRSLIDHKLVKRALDGSTYRRIESRPDPEARRVIRALSERKLA